MLKSDKYIYIGLQRDCSKGWAIAVEVYIDPGKNITGYGQHGGDRYIPVELQRNFSKDAAVSVEYHYGGDKKGFEVKYTRKTDKLFGLF